MCVAIVVSAVGPEGTVLAGTGSTKSWTALASRRVMNHAQDHPRTRQPCTGHRRVGAEEAPGRATLVAAEYPTVTDDPALALTVIGPAAKEQAAA